jgi:hypothetical protein
MFNRLFDLDLLGLKTVPYGADVPLSRANLRI